MAAVGSGDIQRPPGVGAQMAIGEFWPSISESSIQAVADEHRADAKRFSAYGDSVKGKVSKTRELLQGQAGEARAERLTSMFKHAYDVADHLASKGVTAEAYKSTVVGLKIELTAIGDAAQQAWETARKTKTPFEVATYKAEAAAAANRALSDIALAPQPTPVPTDEAGNGSVTPVDNRTQKDEPTAEKDAADTKENANSQDVPSGESGAEQSDKNNYEADLLDEKPTDVGGGVPADAPLTEAPTQPLSDPEQLSTPPAGVGLPTSGMPSAGTPMGGAGSGMGSGLGGVRPPQMPTGLNPLGSANPLKDAATSPAASMSDALSNNPVASAASSFQSGLASGMGASAALPPSSPALEKFTAQHPSVTPVAAPGQQVPVVPAQGTGAAAPSAAAPGAAGGGGVAPMVPPSGGGGGLAPYVPPGGGGGGPVPPPAAATAPASAQPAPAATSTTQQGGSGAPLVAGSSGASAAAALPESGPSPELVLARRILEGLVRGTQVREDALYGGHVEWAVSVLATGAGQVVAIASTAGDGAYLPAGVVIPSSATLAVYDRALPAGWAERFVGVGAAAQLLAAHADALARAGEVRPLALVSGELGVQRPVDWRGGEFESVDPGAIRRAPGEPPEPGGGYLHRLAAVAPEIWEKTRKVLNAVETRVAEAVAQTVLVEATALQGQRPLGTPPLVSDYDLQEVVARLGARQPVDWDAHLQDVNRRSGEGDGGVGLGVLHPPMVLDADDSEVSQVARRVHRHFYRAALIVEMLRCWRSDQVSLADVAYCGWAGGFGQSVDAALTHGLALLDPKSQRPV